MLLLGIALVIFGGIFLTQKKGTPSVVDTGNIATTTKTIAVVPMFTEKFEHKDAYKLYTMDNTYPEASAIKYPEIYEFIKKAKNSFLDDYNSVLDKDAINLELATRPYNFMVSTDIATSSKTVTFIISVYTFQGGAHGGTGVSTFTYDTQGKLITLNDVFSAPYLSVVAPLSKDYFYKTLGGDADKSMIDDGTEAREDNFSSWYLTNNAITFIFGQYQVGPYAIGIQEFRIPTSQISAILSPAYK